MCFSSLDKLRVYLRTYNSFYFSFLVFVLLKLFLKVKKSIVVSLMILNKGEDIVFFNPNKQNDRVSRQGILQGLTLYVDK